MPFSHRENAVRPISLNIWIAVGHTQRSVPAAFGDFNGLVAFCSQTERGQTKRQPNFVAYARTTMRACIAGTRVSTCASRVDHGNHWGSKPGTGVGVYRGPKV